MVLYGDLDVYLNGQLKKLNKGDILTIMPTMKHSFNSQIGCILEELSSTHYIDDSFYTDENIQNSKNRKTIVNYWL